MKGNCPRRGGGVVNAHGGIDLRMYDTTSWVILASHRSEARALARIINGTGFSPGDIVRIK